MNGTAVPATTPAPGWPLYRAMVGIGLICAVLIALVFEATAPTIARNRALALERAVFEVLPGAATSRAFVETEGRFVPAPAADVQAAGRRVYAGYDRDGAVVGVAVEASGMGYQDTIRMLYGYSFDLAAIVGAKVLESRETPGLGDRIESDPDFRRSFERLDAALDSTGAAPLHPIEAVKHGQKTEAWQIDGISGATVSSKAVAELLRASTGLWIADLERRQEDFREVPEP